MFNVVDCVQRRHAGSGCCRVCAIVIIAVIVAVVVAIVIEVIVSTASCLLNEVTIVRQSDVILNDVILKDHLPRGYSLSSRRGVTAVTSNTLPSELIPSYRTRVLMQ